MLAIPESDHFMRGGVKADPRASTPWRAHSGTYWPRLPDHDMGGGIALFSLAQVIDHDAGAMRGERMREFRSDAPTRSGNDRHLALKYARHDHSRIGCRGAKTDAWPCTTRALKCPAMLMRVQQLCKSSQPFIQGLLRKTVPPIIAPSFAR